MALQETLRDLVRQLEQLGYQPFQIDQIIEEAVGTRHWECLSPARQQELSEDLRNHILFAVRCRRVKQR